MDQKIQFGSFIAFTKNVPGGGWNGNPALIERRGSFDILTNLVDISAENVIVTGSLSHVSEGHGHSHRWAIATTKIEIVGDTQDPKMVRVHWVATTHGSQSTELVEAQFFGMIFGGQLRELFENA